MPETAERARERKATARKAGRRREGVTMLQIAEATCRYGAAQLGNGIGPEEARQTALFIAGELEAVAASLRRATRLDGPQRRALAVMFAGRGWGTKQIAETLGVSERAVRYYVNGRPCPGARSAGNPADDDRLSRRAGHETDRGGGRGVGAGGAVLPVGAGVPGTGG